MPPPPASRRSSGGPSRCGGSRAAEPVADRVLLEAEPASTLLARLSEALARHPNARRFIVHGEQHPSFEELVTVSDGYPVSVVGRPVGDTCKEVVDGLVRRTVPRQTLVDLPGPWVFSREGLADALTRARIGEGAVRDLLALSRTAGLRVRVLTGPWARVWSGE